MDNIVYGVTRAIAKAFSENDVRIYEDTIKQGFQKPCFVVLPEGSVVERMSIGRFLKNQTIKVIYYPESLKERAEMEQTAVGICGALRVIKWQGDSYLGKNIRWEADNERLTLKVEYETALYWESSDDESDEGEAYLMGIMDYGKDIGI